MYHAKDLVIQHAMRTILSPPSVDTVKGLYGLIKREGRKNLGSKTSPFGLTVEKVGKQFKIKLMIWDMLEYKYYPYAYLRCDDIKLVDVLYNSKWIEG